MDLRRACLLAGALVVLRHTWEQERPKRKTLLSAGALLGALGIARADGIVLIVTAAAGLVLTRKPSKPRLLSLITILVAPAAVLALQLLFRLTYSTANGSQTPLT